MDGGSVKKFFETSENSLYRKMFSHMREYRTFVPNTTTGVKRAREENYAYITEYPYLEYHNQQKPCNTKLLNNLIQTKSYGLGLQRNSPYTNRITVAILKVREIVFAMYKLVFYRITALVTELVWQLLSPLWMDRRLLEDTPSIRFSTNGLCLYRARHPDKFSLTRRTIFFTLDWVVFVASYNSCCKTYQKL